MSIRTELVLPADGKLVVPEASGPAKVVVKGEFTSTTPISTSGSPVFAVWANEETNVVCQIVLNNQTSGSIECDLTNKLTYDQGFAVFGIAGLVVEWPGLTSSKLRVNVKAGNTTEENLTWSSKAPFWFRVFKEAYTIHP